MLHCWATDQDNSKEDPKFGRMGKQRCENTGPLTRERMKNVDAEHAEGDGSVMRQLEQGPPGMQ